MEIVEDTDSRFPTPVVVSGPRSSVPGPLPPSNIEQPIINIAHVTAASQPSMATVSRPSTPAVPSPPAPIAPSSSATDVRKEGDSPSQSPDHENLGHNYLPPSPDPRGKRSATLSVSKERQLLSRLVELANYLKLLASEKYKKNLRPLSGDFLLNNAIYSTTVVPYLFS